MQKEVSATLLLSVLCCVLHTSCHGLEFQQCASGYVQVPETSQSVDDALTCEGIASNDNVRWQFRPKGSTGAPISIGFCQPDSENCTLLLSTSNPLFTIRRPSADVSHLSFARDISRNYAGATFFCLSASNTVECEVDIIYPAERVNCTAQFNPSPPLQWAVHGRCHVTKIYSSGNRYSCMWFESDGTSNKTVNSRYVTFSTTQSSADFYNGSCSLTGKPTPTTNGNYSYRVEIAPGSVFFAGSIVIRYPHTPTNNCPTDYLPELSRLDCTCRTDDAGSPPGSLEWGTTSSGRLAVDSVDRNRDGSQFTCRLLWIGTNTLSSVYTLRIAYGPDSGSVAITGPNIFDTDGSLILVMNCTFSDVSPAPALKWSGACTGQGRTCSLQPRPPHDVTVSCTVTNAKNNKSDTATKRITLNYPPPNSPVMTGYDGEPLQEGQNLRLTCSVTGGVPQVSSVSIACGAKSETINGHNVTLKMEVAADMHGDKCLCTANWKEPNLYTKMSEVTLNVYYSPVVTSMTAGGASGTVLVNESADHVLLSCTARARPSPDMRLIKESYGELIQRKGGIVGDIQTATLTFQLPARCESSANYSCVADNTLRIPAHETVTLQVVCSPRLTEGNSATIPSVNFKGFPKNLTFEIWTSPSPDRFSFLYLGQTVNDISSAQPARVNMFTMSCLATGASRATCVMILTKATEKDEGFYTVVMTNGVGKGVFTFRVKFNDTDPDYLEDEPEPSRDASLRTDLYIGVGVGACLIVLAPVSVFAVFLVRWWQRQRRKDGAQQVGESEPKRDSGYLIPVVPARQRADMTGRMGPIHERCSGYLSPVELQTAERTGPYDTLDTDDINVASTYDVLSHYDVILDSPADEGREKGPSGQYETLEMKGLRSSYAKIEKVEDGDGAKNILTKKQTPKPSKG